ncbi:glutathione S-transferase family protein [Colwelliaceae bacterium BS250]
MKLYSAWYCPFAQRTWITLEHKRIKFEYTEIDPYDKTPFWMNVSRNYGQVPVIEVLDGNEQARRVVDSFRTMEFIDELYSDNKTRIYPIEAKKKAETKYWMDFVSTDIVPYFYRYLKAHKAGEYRNQSQARMINGVNTFTKAMSAEGPFFMGEQFGAIDIALIPFAYRMNLLLAHYRDFQLFDNLQDQTRFRTWYQAAISEPAFINTCVKQTDFEARLIDFYLPYSIGGGQDDVTDI